MTDINHSEYHYKHRRERIALSIQAKNKAKLVSILSVMRRDFHSVSDIVDQFIGSREFGDFLNRRMSDRDMSDPIKEYVGAEIKALTRELTIGKINRVYNQDPNSPKFKIRRTIFSFLKKSYPSPKSLREIQEHITQEGYTRGASIQNISGILVKSVGDTVQRVGGRSRGARFIYNND